MKDMSNIIYQIIEEYEVQVADLDFKPKGKIIKIIHQNGMETDGKYYGRLSHTCKHIDDALNTNQPELLIGNDFDSVKKKIISYLEKFTTMEVMENKFY
jgi:hypothetical protein